MGCSEAKKNQRKPLAVLLGTEVVGARSYWLICIAAPSSELRMECPFLAPRGARLEVSSLLALG